MLAGRKTLQLVFRAREVVVVGTNHLHHSNRKWKGGGDWQAKPPTRVLSEGGGGGGRVVPGRRPIWWRKVVGIVGGKSRNRDGVYLCVSK